MTPAETLAMAQQLLERADPKTAGLWPRAAALLARQALEQGLDEYWREKAFPARLLRRGRSSSACASTSDDPDSPAAHTTPGRLSARRAITTPTSWPPAMPSWRT